MSEFPLINASELAQRLQHPDVRVVDCRFTLSQPSAGRLAYREGHIPGAVYAHLDDDLAGPVTPRTGRHPLPDPDAFAAILGQWGVSSDTLVVAYDEGAGAVAARLWWMLGWVGHERRRVLDGGLAAWIAGGHPLERGAVSAPRAPAYPVQTDPEREADAAAVMAALDQGTPVIDARGPERFRGEREPIDPVAGHIPGTFNLPFSGNVDAEGRFLSPAELARRYRERISARPGMAIALCGSGVTACHVALAMRVAGLPEPRIYVGSWSEWIRDPDRPVATGPD